MIVVCVVWLKPRGPTSQQTTQLRIVVALYITVNFDDNTSFQEHKHCVLIYMDILIRTTKTKMVASDRLP